MATELERHFGFVLSEMEKAGIKVTKTFRMAGSEYTFDYDRDNQKEYEDDLAGRADMLRDAMRIVFTACGNHHLIYSPLNCCVRAIINYDCGTIVLNFNTIEHVLKVGYVVGE